MKSLAWKKICNDVGKIVLLWIWKQPVLGCKIGTIGSLINHVSRSGISSL